MKTTARVALIMLAGLMLAGCVSKTAQLPPPAPPKVAVSWGDQPLSARDYFLQQEYEDRIDRARGMK
ncbi:MAG: hypothetical protein PSW75_05425 [bacterium]|nr:hypothetical protein [bacterium]MDI1334850.1 hypothetical protein [Lacunisphaera sp.]